jgi:hypothetical protein
VPGPLGPKLGRRIAVLLGWEYGLHFCAHHPAEPPGDHANTSHHKLTWLAVELHNGAGEKQQRAWGVENGQSPFAACADDQGAVADVPFPWLKDAARDRDTGHRPSSATNNSISSGRPTHRTAQQRANRQDAQIGWRYGGGRV